MSSYKRQVFDWDVNYLEIPLQDLPDRGHVIVCKDPQKRLKWAVVISTSEEGNCPPNAKGLFWEKKDALIFARALTENKG